MGISNFHDFIRTNYQDAFYNIKPTDTYSHVYIDINYALHYCAYSVKTEEELFNKLYEFFDSILKLVQPTKSVVFSIDGLAPLSKMILQRKRRNIIAPKKSDEKTNNNFNTILLTCGTDFMLSVYDKISNYIEFITYIYNIEVELLDCNIDEAELKLKKKMMDNIEQDRENKDTHLFVTNDADVIVMLSTLKNYSNVYVYCKMKYKNYSRQIIQILSIKKLIELHSKSINSNQNIKTNLNYDFAAISILMGNDYIPKIYSLTFDKLWDSYKNTIKNYPDGLIQVDDRTYEFNINIEFLNNLFVNLLVNTKKHFINKSSIHNTNKELYQNYFDGFTWCLDMYIKGECSRYDYVFIHDYNPMIYGVLTYINSCPHYLKLVEKTTLSNSLNKPLDRILYLICVIPEESIYDMVDKKYHAFIKKNKSIYNIKLDYDIINKLSNSFSLLS